LLKKNKYMKKKIFTKKKYKNYFHLL